VSQTSARRCQSQACRRPLVGIVDGMLYPLQGGLVLRLEPPRIRCEECGYISEWERVNGKTVRRELPAVLQAASYPAIEQIIKTMQERWEAFRVEKLRKRGAIAVGLRFDVFMRDGFACRYCGISVEDGAILHADHVIAQSKGGPTTLENLVTACMDCNLGKRDKDLPA
jgi:5-methylcytosine-specific restriction endonuclease McrA